MNDVGWAAGLFEGEGAVTSCGGRRRLQLKMVEEESVRRFHVLCGGSVYGPYGPYKSSLGSRPHWLWVAENGEADAAVGLLYPFFSEWRRVRVRALFPDVLAELELEPADALWA